MQIPLIQVDAFAERLFTGNPAAVCPFVEFPSDELLQSIAAENNLSETAFLMPVPTPGRYRLRWFTPALEVDLCGHATLAAAHVVFTRLRTEASSIAFETRSGVLTVIRDGKTMSMDFPAVLAEPGEVPAEVLAAMGGPVPQELHVVPSVHGADYFMLVYQNRAEILEIAPNFSLLHANVIVTAAGGDGNEVDFVSRFFGPASGVNEDPVTGSAHCTLTPYWAAKLGKTKLVARQLSRRGGTVECELRDERVWLSGRCVDYLEGTINI